MRSGSTSLSPMLSLFVVEARGRFPFLSPLCSLSPSSYSLSCFVLPVSCTLPLTFYYLSVYLSLGCVTEQEHAHTFLFFWLNGRNEHIYFVFLRVSCSLIKASGLISTGETFQSPISVSSLFLLKSL